ncbi:unnamed protein product [Pleuronectes platessa]|uniref:Uncharacterized protein n=1 Tax=Pleuronectes platessa TaxID=8262 RepID=A0A9N7W1Z8_PLEPL|nr:unnamed protein product [Pleuronectes platessa]
MHATDDQKVGLLMTAKLHLAPGMRGGPSQTSEHQTALGSVNLIALDSGFIGSRRPNERRGAKAKPDFLSRISFSSVSHARRRVLRRRGPREERRQRGDGSGYCERKSKCFTDSRGDTLRPTQQGASSCQPAKLVLLL